MATSLGSAVLELKVDSAALRSGLSAAEKDVSGSLKTMGLGMTAAGAAGIVGFGLAAKAAISFDATIAKTIGLTGASREEMEKLRGEVLKLAPAVGIGPKELADALYFILSSGIDAAGAMDVLTASARAAAAGLGDTVVVADTVTSVLNAYKLSADEAGWATDVLTQIVKEGKGEPAEFAGELGKVIPIAAQMGITFEEVGANVALMTRVGFDAATATTGLRATMVAFLKPSEEMKQVVAGLGLSMEDLRRKIKEEGLLSVLQLLMEATGENSSVMASLFPNVRALSDVLGTVGSQGEAYVDVLGQMADAGGLVSGALSEMEQTTSHKLAKLKASFDVMLISIGTELEPAISGMAGAMQQFLGWVDQIPEPLRKMAVLAGAGGSALLLLNGMLLLGASGAASMAKNVQIAVGSLMALRASLAGTAIGGVLLSSTAGLVALGAAIAYVGYEAIAKRGPIHQFFYDIGATEVDLINMAPGVRDAFNIITGGFLDTYEAGKKADEKQKEFAEHVISIAGWVTQAWEGIDAAVASADIAPDEAELAKLQTLWDSMGQGVVALTGEFVPGFKEAYAVVMAQSGISLESAQAFLVQKEAAGAGAVTIKGFNAIIGMLPAASAPALAALDALAKAQGGTKDSAADLANYYDGQFRPLIEEALRSVEEKGGPSLDSVRAAVGALGSDTEAVKEYLTSTEGLPGVAAAFEDNLKLAEDALGTFQTALESLLPATDETFDHWVARLDEMAQDYNNWESNLEAIHAALAANTDMTTGEMEAALDMFIDKGPGFTADFATKLTEPMAQEMLQGVAEITRAAEKAPGDMRAGILAGKDDLRIGTQLAIDYGIVQPIENADLATKGAALARDFINSFGGALLGSVSTAAAWVGQWVGAIDEAMHSSPEYVTYKFGQGAAEDLGHGWGAGAKVAEPTIKETTQAILESGVLGPLVALGAEMKGTVELALAGLNDQIKVQEDYLADLDDATKQITESQQAWGDEVDRLGGLLDDANDDLRRFTDAQIEGTGRYDDALFSLEIQMDKLKLKINDLKQQRLGLDEESSKAKALDKSIEDLEEEVDALGLKADELRLEERIKFDPLQRKIDKLTDTTEEMSFEDIIAGITGTQAVIEDLTDALAGATSQVEAHDAILKVLSKSQEYHQDILDGVKDKYDELKDALEDIDPDLAKIAESMGEGYAEALNQAFKAMELGNTKTAGDAVAAAQAMFDDLEVLVEGSGQEQLLVPLGNVLAQAQALVAGTFQIEIPAAVTAGEEPLRRAGAAAVSGLMDGIGGAGAASGLMEAGRGGGAAAASGLMEGVSGAGGAAGLMLTEGFIDAMGGAAVQLAEAGGASGAAAASGLMKGVMDGVVGATQTALDVFAAAMGRADLGATGDSWAQEMQACLGEVRNVAAQSGIDAALDYVESLIAAFGTASPEATGVLRDLYLQLSAIGEAGGHGAGGAAGTAIQKAIDGALRGPVTDTAKIGMAGVVAEAKGVGEIGMPKAADATMTALQEGLAAFQTEAGQWGGATMAWVCAGMFTYMAKDGRSYAQATGRTFIDGIIEGLNQEEGSLYDRIAEIIEAAIVAANAAAGAASPAKRFIQMGANFAASLQAGWGQPVLNFGVANLGAASGRQQVNTFSPNISVYAQSGNPADIASEVERATRRAFGSMVQRMQAMEPTLGA